MTTAIREFSETYTDCLWLDFTPQERDAFWKQSRQDSSQDRSRYNAYLNRLCLSTVMAWLEEEKDELDLESVQVWQSESLPSIWEMVNGTAIAIGDTKIVLIPSDADNNEELIIPQEWVDIPEWKADYYVGVQVDPEECWLKIWGYTSHKQIKEKGEYFNLNQVYSLLKSQLIEDIYIMLAGMEFNPVTQVEVAPLPVLSAAEAEGLIARLSQATPYSPRLDAPFEQWGALLSNDEWRNSLFKRRNNQISEVAETSIQADVNSKSITSEEKKAFCNRLLKKCRDEFYDQVDFDSILQLVNKVQQSVLEDSKAIISEFVNLLSPDSTTYAGATRSISNDDEDEDDDWDDEDEEDIEEFAQSLTGEVINFLEIDENK